MPAVLWATGPVLLDFDGPMTSLLAGGRNRLAADRLRLVLHGQGVALPAEIATTNDPLEILRQAGRSRNVAAVNQVEAELRRCEIEAAHDSSATAGAADFLAACHDTQRPVVIVSNNGAEAIRAYLDLHQLRGHVHQVIGRPYARPELMKPHPAIVLSALAGLGTEPDRCVLVGDSITDIQVARATGVRSIGYVKAPERPAGLEAAGADATTESMRYLATLTRAVGPVPRS
ncbi:MAG: HAD family phosphatase [Mycobacterium sp.]|nr:HAD family phosphatase [Mycobacterium sp.]